MAAGGGGPSWMVVVEYQLVQPNNTHAATATARLLAIGIQLDFNQANVGNGEDGRTGGVTSGHGRDEAGGRSGIGVDGRGAIAVGERERSGRRDRR